MNKNRDNDFVCPQCHGPLCLQDDRLNCGKCPGSFPIISDIPCFASGSSAWRFSTSESTSEIIETARNMGWEKSLSKMDKEEANWIHGAGRFTIAVLASPKKRVLDTGCGWGGLSFWMAKEFGHVYALDIKLDGLQFLKIRAFQEKVNNITAAQGSLFSLPFPAGFFDVVVLNGVLEWVGTFSKEHPPIVMQEMALNEMARVLHPDGILYVAIENRFGLQYFLGYREEHTGLRYISLLPRSLANGYHRYRRGEEFRAVTHSRRGLTLMLKKCGFSKTKWFSIFPSYRNCKYAASMEGTGAIKFLLNNALSHRSSWPAVFLRTGLKATSRIPLLLKLLSLFSPSWIIFASQERAPQLALQSKETLITIETDPDLKPAITINERRANIFVIEKSSGRLKGKYAIPVNEWATRKIEMSHYTVALIRKLCPSLSKNLPEISKYSTKYGLLEYTKAVPGVTLDPRESKDLNPILDLLVTLNEISLNENEIQGIPGSFDIRGPLSGLAKRHGLTGKIQDLLKRAQILHGDLDRRNILLSKVKPRMPVLIDFEHAKIGPAVLNWYDFVLRNFVIYGGQYPLETSVVMERCRKLPGNENAKSVLNRLTVKFLEACQVPLSLHSQLTALYMSYLCQDPVVTEPEVIISALRSMDLNIDMQSF